MPFRRLLVASLAAAAVVPSACLRLKKEPSVLDELKKTKLAAPQPPLPVAGGDTPPAAGGVQPPRFDPKSSPVPALPGMPGTPSQPLPPTAVPDSPSGRADDLSPAALLAAATPEERQALLAASDDDDKRKGILERIRDRLQQRRERERERDKEKEKDKLPPATDPPPPKKGDALPKGVPPLPPNDDALPKGVPPLPSKDDALPKLDAPPRPKLELKAEPRGESARSAAAAGDLKAVRELLDAARKKNEATPSFEAHLVKREVVKGKEQPAEEAVYRFRREPLSVHLRVVGEVGGGREVMWVKGQNDNKMTLVTGKGDNILLGAGKKMTMDPDDPLVTVKSRYRIYEAGMQRPIGALGRFVEQAEAGKRPAESVRYLGPVDRKEYRTRPTAVEVTLTADDDKFLPKGGKRVYHFDADPKSPAFGLPVLVISLDHEGREVEYYCFTDFRLVGELTDADFDHTKVGKKR